MQLQIPEQYRTISRHEAAPPPCNAEAYAAQQLAQRQVFEAQYPMIDLIMVLTIAVILLGSIVLQRSRS